MLGALAVAQKPTDKKYPKESVCAHQSTRAHAGRAPHGLPVGMRNMLCVAQTCYQEDHK